ncbi:MAG: ROK family protein [Chloroflexota bacterium]|nr:ROK family protein [Chloroflexota bacterium]
MVTRSTEAIVNDFSITTKILGLNISGPKTSIVYGDMNGLIYERMQMVTPSKVPFLECFDAICSQVDKLLKVCRAQGLATPGAISVAVSGPLDIRKGTVLSPPDLPQWEDAQLKGRLSVRYNLPVFIEHRSNAAALAEVFFGAGTGVDNLLFIDMEPVVSIGMILDGSVYHGAHDAAGDVGHMRMDKRGPGGLGSPGSLTGFASSFGMAELASLRFPDHWPSPPNPYEIVRLVNAGDSDALAVVEEAAHHLGKALLWLIFSYDPEQVIFGHPGDLLGESLLTPLRDDVLVHGGGEARQLPQLAVSKLGAKLDDTAALMAVINLYKTQGKQGTTPG